MNWLNSLNFATLAFLAGLFTWAITILGSSIVFLFKNVHKSIMDGMLGLASGVMLAASFWSLLSPALEMCENLHLNGWLTASLGLLGGGLFLFLGDKIYQIIRKEKQNNTKKKRSLMLIISITLHNIPEGLAVGVAFGSLGYNLNGATLASALMLALGIGIQNFPEGSAISLPLKRDGMKSFKAFLIGSLSGIVEPIASLIGAILVLKIRYLLPSFLAFAAGAMIYVVVQELIPESQTNKRKDLMALFTIFGFIIMMILDVALG